MKTYITGIDSRVDELKRTSKTGENAEQIQVRDLLRYKTAIYKYKMRRTDQGYRTRKARYKYKRGKKWNAIECLRMFVTPT